MKSKSGFAPRLAATLVAVLGIPLAGQDNNTEYIGSEACGGCHASHFSSQSKTGHARALRRAQPTDPGPGRRADWAFGAGHKAITWVSQTGEDTIVEHGLTWYASTKSLALTPGHAAATDLVYRTFDSVATALRCFRCHSTGPVTLTSDFKVQPTEPGVRCESCHGPGRSHAQSRGVAAIQNPKRLTAVQINTLCGSCHRQANDLDDDRDWSNAWNVRHQPTYLHRAACFRNSNGALSCLTCHDLHQPLKTAAASYDAACASCHRKVAHKPPAASGSCVGCHMPQTSPGFNLTFTNHWIGIYDPRGRKLIPSRRSVEGLHPAPVKEESAGGFIVPADASTLIPVYAQALVQRERQSGADGEKVARAASDLGNFLLELGRSAEAEAPLRRAISIGEQKRDPGVDADRERLGRSLEAQDKRDEAFVVFRQAAEGSDPQVAARAFAKLAEMDPEHADSYYQRAIAAEEKSSGASSPRVAILLHDHAMSLRARRRDPEAEPLLRRALAIQQTAGAADPRVTIGVLNALGNLVEGRRQFDEAEKLLRGAIALAERKFGPESVELARSCTNLADVLWNKKNLREAGQLFRRAITINASLFGPDRPETAADIANLGMLMSAAGQREAGLGLLQQALAIYEKALGPDSDPAKFLRDQIAKAAR